MGCRGFFAIPATGATFFLSSWLTMIFAGIVPAYFGVVQTLSYVESMIATIGLWLVVAPLVGTVARRGWRMRGWGPGRWRRRDMD